mmetsp:Transcript_30835/g.30381  ORF Transcript_30835/g.30381 Transcript_30835/m.30381 type:complete len:81 (-) Transcript_30835:780-1022(-)
MNLSPNTSKSVSKKRKLSSGRPLSSKVSKKKVKLQTMKSTKAGANQLNPKASLKIMKELGKSRTGIPINKKRKLPSKRID